MELGFIRLSEEARTPTRANEGDAGLDLYAAEAATIGPGERPDVGTGIAVEIPDGYAGLVLPRSGLAPRHGIALVTPRASSTRATGGSCALLLNTDRADAFDVAPGHRIAQLLVTPFAGAAPLEAGELAASARADRGFGSSGR